MQPRKLTDDQVRYIQEHPFEPPADMARKFGCYKETIYYWMNKNEGETYLTRLREERRRTRQAIFELYPTYSGREISNMLGIKKDTVNTIAASMGVKHTEETNKRIQKEGLDRLMLPENVEKKRVNHDRMLKMEKFRVASGMKQKTRIRLTKNISPKVLAARCYIVHTYGYIYKKEYGNLFALFYDSNTKRLPEGRERYYSEKYKLKFLPADE